MLFCFGTPSFSKMKRERKIHNDYFVPMFIQIYDCDFNQQLGLAVGCSDVHEGGKTVFDITTLSDLKSDSIRTDNHCYGCTAGFGSSCQGATV